MSGGTGTDHCGPIEGGIRNTKDEGESVYTAVLGLHRLILALPDSTLGRVGGVYVPRMCASHTSDAQPQSLLSKTVLIHVLELSTSTHTFNWINLSTETAECSGQQSGPDTLLTPIFIKSRHLDAGTY